MEKSSFFNSVEGDRIYTMLDWVEYFASFISNGIFPLPSSGLQVVAGEGMSVIIKAGKAWINGYFYYNTTDLTVPLDVAHGSLKRIDRIVVQWNLTNRTITAVTKSSPPSTSPSAPAIQRDTDIFELCLADVMVNAGVISISQANITDRRLDSSLCGVAAGMITQIDTTTFNAQLEAWFDEYKVFTENEFNAWFATVQDTLEGDAAGNLLMNIEAHKENADAHPELNKLTILEPVAANEARVVNVCLYSGAPPSTEGKPDGTLFLKYVP